jgi:hypothetical protein
MIREGIAKGVTGEDLREVEMMAVQRRFSFDSRRHFRYTLSG